MEVASVLNSFRFQELVFGCVVDRMDVYLQHPRPAKFLPFLQKLLFWSRSNYFCSQAFFCLRDKFRCSLTIATAFFANQTAFFADQTAFFADHSFRGVSQRRFFFVTAFFHHNNWNFCFSRQRQKFCTTGCCRYICKSTWINIEIKKKNAESHNKYTYFGFMSLISHENPSLQWNQHEPTCSPNTPVNLTLYVNTITQSTKPTLGRNHGCTIGS